jgi:predicted RNA-binding protein YlxR (DUF448 family)
VRNKEKIIIVDAKNNSDGRGAYICKNEVCVEKAKKKNALKRALKCDLSDDIYSLITEEVNSGKDI